MQRDQRGFSLVEIIVVLAIMGILAGVSVTMVRQIGYANTQKVVEEISSMLEKQRITAMSREGTWYLYIYEPSDGGEGCYMKVLNVWLDGADSQLDSSGIKLCSGSISIFNGDEDTGTIVAGDDIIRIAFTKTGLFSSDTNVFTGDPQGTIVVSGTGSNTLTLIRTTGKHYVE